MNFQWWNKLPMYAPDGGDDGGGGGGGDGGQFGDLGPETAASVDQVKLATDYLAKIEGFDPKSIEGKQPNEIWNMARTHEQGVLKDPLRGTPFQGHKVPEKFVVEKDGRKSVDVGKLMQAHRELEQAQFSRRDGLRKEIAAEIETERLKNRPEKAELYTPTAEKLKFKGADGKEVEGFGLKVGDRQVQVIENDPLLGYMKEVAHRHGLTNEEFHDVVKGYVEATIKALPNWPDEAKALGGEAVAEKREARVTAFLKGNLSAENYGFFATLPSSARSIQAVEQLMTLSGHPPFVPEKGDVQSEAYTREDLAKMQRDPRYTGEGRPGGPDKQFVQQVRAGYARLAKSGAA
jgi:hypothetical protein